MVSRKYFQKGRMSAAVSKDPYTTKAIEILKEKNSYNKILGNK
jgi:hypothetical protein